MDFVTSLSPVEYTTGLVALGAATVGLLFTLFKKDPKKEFYPPMSPMGLFETLKKMTGDQFPFVLAETARKLNSHTFRVPLPMPGAKMVAMIGDAALAREILNDPSSTVTMAVMKPLDNIMNGNPTMISTNGENWSKRRHSVAVAFGTKHVKRMIAVVEEKVEKWEREFLEPLIQKNDGKSATFEVERECIGITLDTITEAAFQYDLSREEKEAFLHNIHVTTEEFFLKTISNPLRNSWFWKERREAIKASLDLMAFAKRIMENYRKIQNPIPGTVINILMTNKEAYKTENECAAEIILMLIAGHDTSGSSISFALLEIARNNKLQDQLRSELSKLSPADQPNCNLLKWIVRESMRMYPPAALGTVRTTHKDFVYNGYKKKMIIPKGSVAFCVLSLTARDPKVYDKPDEFIPERWEKATKAMNDSNMPFSAGRRVCVGQSLAKAEIHSVVPILMGKYKMELEYEGPLRFFVTLQAPTTRIKLTKL